MLVIKSGRVMDQSLVWIKFVMFWLMKGRNCSNCSEIQEEGQLK